MRVRVLLQPTNFLFRVFRIVLEDMCLGLKVGLEDAFVDFGGKRAWLVVVHRRSTVELTTEGVRVR